MGVVPIRRCVFDMSRVNCNPTGALFGSPVNFIVILATEVTHASFAQNLGNSSRQGRLPVVDVTNGSYV